MRKLINIYINFLSKHKTIRAFIDKYFDILNLNNLIGFNKAFQLYYDWILEETDFCHEVENIKSYQAFANSVNGKVENTKKIVLPQVFENLCSENIIVMEFIEHPNINSLNSTEQQKALVNEALNSYLQLSFYAMFNNLPVIFHGDPHGGNIYLDEEGNIGFLDMGLLFQLSPTDLKLTEEFFLAAYTGNCQKLFQMILQYSILSSEEKIKLQNEIQEYCNHIKEKNVTSYFADMINICIKYNISPPSFLFSMAKAFVCLNGINYLSGNTTIGFELLKKQTLEYLIKRNLKNVQNLGITMLKLSPRLLNGTVKFALTKTLSKDTYDDLNSLASSQEFREFLESAQTFLALIKMNLDNMNNKAR